MYGPHRSVQSSVRMFATTAFQFQRNGERATILRHIIKSRFSFFEKEKRVTLPEPKHMSNVLTLQTS